jgi:hypothetical protein
MENIMPRYVELSAMWRRHWRWLAIAMLFLFAGLAQAQSAADDDRADPPSRVARLSYVAGDLGFLPAGATDWSDADVNRPLTTGDRLSTGHDARAELELGGGTLRIDGQTDLGVLDLNDQIAQLELTRGTLNLTVRQLEPGQSYEIDTPTVALVLDQPGTFRVDIDDDGTQVTAFSGSAVVYGEDNAQRTINSGRGYRFADSRLGAVAISEIGGGDAFDAWCDSRDRRYAQSISRRYVSDDVVGYQDLDQYGDWQETSDYGAVWYPSRVGNDWAPYRDGHWAYIAPWGWTWVDDSPWGYAPYHYGRWAHTRRGWGWIPGPRDVRAIYAPALVAFVGGGGWSVGIGGVPVGWFPLGPGEIYNPWYHCGRNYYVRINRHDGRDGRGRDRRNDDDIRRHYEHYRAGRPEPDEHYVNRNAPRGFTAVPGRAFASGRHVQRDLLRIDPRKLADAKVSPRGAALRPVADNIRNPRTHARPAEGFRPDVVARHEPATLVRPGSASNPDTARRIGRQASNVRLLNPRGVRQDAGLSRDDHDGSDRVAAGRTLSPPARITPAGRLAPAPEVAAGRSQTMRRDNAIGSRQGELPSTRFAHRPASEAPLPGRREQQARMPIRESRDAMPRPGLSVISRADENDTRPNGRGLPPVQPVRRATPADRPLSAGRPMPANAARFERVETMHAVRNEPMPARRNIEPRVEPRVERVDSFARQPVRAQPRPMPAPVRAESMRNYQPAQRAAPAPRAETPRPQRTRERSSERADHPVKANDRQH